MRDKTLQNLKEHQKRQAESQRVMLPIAEPQEHELIVADLARAEQLLDTHPGKSDRGFSIYRGFGEEIPVVMLELGRLREETFRTVGEGTGQDRDVDRFDPYYHQLIAWDKRSQEITGAYRIGQLDELLRVHGPDGIYTNTLFQVDELLQKEMCAGTLEAGRSFVRMEHQRGPTLMLIWMGIAKFLIQHKQYKHLMGPVSISNDFQENSKHLMVSYLMKYHPHEKSKMVKSKNPPKFDSTLSPEELTEIVDSSMNLKGLQDFVRQAEGNPRAQIPQLIKLYLELGVRFIAFNKDEDFNTIDGLIWLDLLDVPEAIMKRYMGEDGWTDYKKFHQRI